MPKTLFVISGNLQDADKAFSTWSPDSWVESTKWCAAFHPTRAKAEKEIAKQLKWADAHLSKLATIAGEKHRMEYARLNLTGWGSWEADRFKSEIRDVIASYKIFTYIVPSFGDAFKRATP